MPEREDAARYWAERRLGAFSRPREWSGAIARTVLSFGPRSVLEFGCNVGRHMQAISDLDPDVRVVGVEISLPAVHEARARGRHVLLGDESTLALWPDDAFDVAYTVSVLDHLPSPMHALTELDRIARVLVLVEPWVGSEGKVTHIDLAPANPYLYSWRYEDRLPEREWTVTPYPLHSAGAGPYYQMHVGVAHAGALVPG